jgi:ribonucleoside-diphosphate reductase alpha chain
MTRRTLPQRRRAETFSLTACNQQLIITLGFYPDNSLGEIFVGVGKTGNDIQAIARDGAVLVSLALQHGVALETIHHAMIRDSSGAAASILGAIVDCISTKPFPGDGQ